MCFVGFQPGLSLMPRFNYRARDAQGQLVQGIIEAADRAGAIVAIEQKRCVPIKIEAAGAEAAKPAATQKNAGAPGTSGAAASRNEPVSFKGRAAAVPAPTPPASTGAVTNISHNQRLFFTEQLAYLLSVGMTLDEALGILVKRLKQPTLQKLTSELHQGLLEGRSFSQVLREFPRIFTPLYVNLVMAGEASGALDDILTRLVKHLTSMKQLRDRVTGALIYPAFLVVAGIGLIIIFITVMVPQLKSFFSNTGGGALPLPTRVLIEANRLITSYWWIGVLAGILTYSLFKAYTKSPAGRLRWDRFKLVMPAFGSVLSYQFYAQFARTMGTLLQNGVTLLRTMELLEDMSGNTFLKARMAETRGALIEGSSLSNALARQRVFPELYVDMMAVGEQSGRFAETMQMVADVYERELDQRIKVATAIIPPIIIVIIAALVGAVVFSIISAVFSVSQGLSHSH